MSLPLRNPLENITLDRALEDLLVRFIINCPPEDLSSVERELFQFEEASWFYTDFIKLMNPSLPNLKIKSFAQQIIKLCPLVWKWEVKAEQALQKFSQYKKTIPVRGAAIFNESMTKILLVKGTESESWSFPRGKISKDEDDVDCCIREVMEEIGFDLSDYIDEEQFIEKNIMGKNYKIFLARGVPEDFDFKPHVRNEIADIQWRDFKKLNKTIHKSNVKYYLVNAMIRPLTIWVKRQKHVKDDDKLKLYAEEQLKLLLGIKKDETVDPGRELLNILQTAVTNTTANIDENTTHPLPQQIPPPPFIVSSQQMQQQFPFMGFQPFAPFPYANGGVPLPPAGPHTAIPVGGMTPAPTSQQIMTSPPAAPQTPSVSEFAKPTFLESSTNSSSSKELLDLLKKKDDEKKPKLKLLKRGQTLQDVVDEEKETSSKELLSLLKNSQNEQQPESKREENDDSKVLLDMLKGPKKNPQVSQKNDNEASSNGNSLLRLLKNPLETSTNDSIPAEDIASLRDEYDEPSSSSKNDSMPSHYDSETEEDRSYEDFESSSEEEDELEQLGKKEDVEDSLAANALLENNFLQDEVPHIELKKGDVSRVSTNGAHESSKSNPQVRPKIKLLKRGQKLGDVVSPKQQTNESLNAVSNEDAYLQKNQSLGSLERQRDEPSPQPSINGGQTLLRMIKTQPQPQPNVSAEQGSGYNSLTAENLQESNSQANTSTAGHLLGVLKKEHTSPFSQQSAHQQLFDEGKNLLNQIQSPVQQTTPHFIPVMASPPPSNMQPNMPLPPLHQHNPQYPGMPMFQPPPVPQASDASMRLLGMLQNPHQQHSMPFHGGMPYGQPQVNTNASNELLGILQKK